MYILKITKKIAIFLKQHNIYISFENLKNTYITVWYWPYPILGKHIINPIPFILLSGMFFCGTFFIMYPKIWQCMVINILFNFIYLIILFFNSDTHKYNLDNDNLCEV